MTSVPRSEHAGCPVGPTLSARPSRRPRRCERRRLCWSRRTYRSPRSVAVTRRSLTTCPGHDDRQARNCNENTSSNALSPGVETIDAASGHGRLRSAVRGSNRLAIAPASIISCATTLLPSAMAAGPYPQPANMLAIPAVRAATTSLRWSPSITARSVVPPAHATGRQQMRRVGFADRKTVAAADRAHSRHQAERVQQARAARLRLVGANRQPPALAPPAVQHRRHLGKAGSPPRRARCNRRQNSATAARVRRLAARGEGRSTRPPRRRPPSPPSAPADERPPARSRPHQPVQRRGNVRHGVHQRAVQIQQQGRATCCTPKRELNQRMPAATLTSAVATPLRHATVAKQGQGMQATAVILAAGLGTRMKSALPKTLHRIAGRSMLRHLLASCEPVFDRIVVVLGPDMDAVRQEAAPHACVVQHERLGTAHAALQAVGAFRRRRGRGALRRQPADPPRHAAPPAGPPRRRAMPVWRCWRSGPPIPAATAG